MSFVYRRIFNIVKGIIPKISDTEIIALKSGGVSIDRELFSGKVDYTKLYAPLPVSNVTLGLRHSVDGRETLNGQNPAHTEKQKDYFLPKLADGSMIPCFALTGPSNGSDAVGAIDRGVVKWIDGRIQIEIVLNKRYITLAPIANLIESHFISTTRMNYSPITRRASPSHWWNGRNPGWCRTRGTIQTMPGFQTEPSKGRYALIATKSSAVQAASATDGKC